MTSILDIPLRLNEKNEYGSWVLFCSCAISIIQLNSCLFLLSLVLQQTMNSGTGGRKQFFTTVEKTQRRPQKSYYEEKGESQYPEQETNPQQSRNISQFDLHERLLYPIIHKMKEENDFISSQCNKISNDMQRLNQLSQFLLQQNAKLKHHYYKRTEDLHKVITSLMINNKQELQDYKHLINLSLNHSSRSTKYLENLKLKGQQIDRNIAIYKAKVTQANKKNLQLEITNSRKLKNVQSEKTFLRIKQRRGIQPIDLQELQTTISELCFEILRLKKNNWLKVERVKKQVNSPNNNRSLINNRAFEAIKQRRNLQSQIQNLQELIRKEMSKKKQAEDVNERLQPQIKEKVKKNESLKSKLLNLVQKNHFIEQCIQKSQKKKASLIELRNEKIEQKRKLYKQLEQSKKQSQDSIKKYDELKSTVENTVSGQIKRIKQEIEENNQYLEEQLRTRIFPLKRDQRQYLDSLNQQLHSLTSKIKQAENIINSRRWVLKKAIAKEWRLS